PYGDRVHGTRVAGAQQALALHAGRVHEHREALGVELKRLRRCGDAVAEAHAQLAVDAHPELAHRLLEKAAHIPSNPSSVRAVSITAGVISAMPRSLA